MSESVVVEAQGISAQAGERELFSNLSFQIEAGGCLVLRGPNGSGKTTLLHQILGLRQSTGEIRIHGRPVDESAAWFRTAVASVVGPTQFFDHMTALEHLDLLARTHRCDPSDAPKALERVGLAPLADSFPGTLSSGETQRLALATALVRPCDVLVLDEPEQRLDDDGRLWLADVLAELTNQGKVLIFASHDARLTDAVASAVIDLGRDAAGDH